MASGGDSPCCHGDASYSMFGHFKDLEDKKGLHDLSVTQTFQHETYETLWHERFKWHDLPTVHWTCNSLFRSPSVVQSANGKEAVWRLLYECGRREEHRSDVDVSWVPHMLRSLGWQVGRVTTIRKLFVLGG